MRVAAPPRVLPLPRDVGGVPLPASTVCFGALLFEPRHGNLLAAGAICVNNAQDRYFIQRLAGAPPSSLPEELAVVKDVGFLWDSLRAVNGAEGLVIDGPDASVHYLYADDLSQPAREAKRAGTRETELMFVLDGEYLVVDLCDTNKSKHTLSFLLAHKDTPCHALRVECPDVMYQGGEHYNHRAVQMFGSRPLPGGAHELLFVTTAWYSAPPAVYGIALPPLTRDLFPTTEGERPLAPLFTDCLGDVGVVDDADDSSCRGPFVQCGAGSDLMACVADMTTVHVYRIPPLLTADEGCVNMNTDAPCECVGTLDLVECIRPQHEVCEIDEMCWGAPGVLYVAYSIKVAAEAATTTGTKVPTNYILPLYVTPIPRREALRHGLTLPAEFRSVVRAVAGLRVVAARWNQEREQDEAITDVSRIASSSPPIGMARLWMVLPEELFEVVLDELWLACAPWIY